MERSNLARGKGNGSFPYVDLHSGGQFLTP